MRLILTTIFVFAALLSGCAETNDWSKRIVSQTEHPPAQFISPHIDDVNVLIVDGRRFEHARGLKTFYLCVPETNAIVFVVDNGDYSITYHVYKMDTREDIQIHASGSAFGRSIGSHNSGESIEEVGNGRIVLGYLDRGAKSTLKSLADLDSIKSLYYLDLAKRTVIAEKTMYYDKAGKVILERNSVPPY